MMHHVFHYRRVVAAGALASMPMTAAAQQPTFDNFEVINSITLWSAVVIGLAVSIAVFVIARMMRGGLFGLVLLYVAVGMALVVVSFFSMVIPPWTYPEVVKSVHDVLFVFGYVLMGMGAWKLMRGIPRAMNASSQNAAHRSSEQS